MTARRARAVLPEEAAWDVPDKSYWCLRRVGCERGLCEVVGGEIEVPALGGHHRLGTGGQRRVPDGERLVVVEVPPLLLRGEGGAAHLHRQYQVGGLDDLLAVQLEVRVVQ